MRETPLPEVMPPNEEAAFPQSSNLSIHKVDVVSRNILSQRNHGGHSNASVSNIYATPVISLVRNRNVSKENGRDHANSSVSIIHATPVSSIENNRNVSRGSYRDHANAFITCIDTTSMNNSNRSSIASQSSNVNSIGQSNEDDLICLSPDADFLNHNPTVECNNNKFDIISGYFYFERKVRTVVHFLQLLHNKFTIFVTAKWCSSLRNRWSQAFDARIFG